MPLNLGAVGSEREFAAVHAKAADELEQVIASGNRPGDLETRTIWPAVFAVLCGTPNRE